MAKPTPLTTLADAFDRRVAYGTVKTDLDSKGLLDDALATTLDNEVAILDTLIAAELKYPAGGKPTVVLYGGQTYVYDQAPDGTGRYEPITPVDAHSFGLKTIPVPDPAPAAAEASAQPSPGPALAQTG